MSEKGISRRQFVGGAVVAAAATAMPVAAGVSTAAATPALAVPLTDYATLDPKVTARLSWEIYKGGNAPLQAG